MIDVEVPCSCPGSPHTGDTVSMPDVADVRIGAAVMAAVRNTPSSVTDMEGAISQALLHSAIRAWSFTDEKREPLDVTVENIDKRLTWAHGGLEVAEKANELYAGDVFDPFVRRMSKASSSTPMDSSTSPQSEPGSNTDSSDKPSLRAVSGGRRSGAKAS